MISYSAANTPDKYFIIHIPLLFFCLHLDELHSQEKTNAGDP